MTVILKLGKAFSGKQTVANAKAVELEGESLSNILEQNIPAYI